MQVKNELEDTIIKGRPAAGKRDLRVRIYNKRYLYFMMLPALLLTIIFGYIPLSGWIMAFKNYRLGFPLSEVPWVGLRFFKTFFLATGDFMYLLRNTLVMNVSSLFLTLFSAVCFAILLKEITSTRFKKFVQTVTFFPFFISWVIIYAIAKALLAQTSGGINEMLVFFGFVEKGVNFLGSSDYSWPLMILMNLWKGIGFNAVIFIAAIAAINEELYEAAEIDGAGRFRKIYSITLPHLMSTLVVLLIMNAGWILQSDLGKYFLFTNSTNWETMEVLDMYVYKFGLRQLQISYATAVGIIKSIVSVGLVFFVNYLSRKLSGRSVF